MTNREITTKTYAEAKRNFAIMYEMTKKLTSHVEKHGWDSLYAFENRYGDAVSEAYDKMMSEGGYSTSKWYKTIVTVDSAKRELLAASIVDDQIERGVVKASDRDVQIRRWTDGNADTEALARLVGFVKMMHRN